MARNISDDGETREEPEAVSRPQSLRKSPAFDETTSLLHSRDTEWLSNTLITGHTPRPSPSSIRSTPYTENRQEDDSMDAYRGSKNPINGGVQLRLLNSGSVARDHLASERTYLAYVRTSLGLASAGVALMQFLHLNYSTRLMAAPLGAITILSGLMVLLIGTQRFFLVQRTLVLGYYPVTTVAVGLISFTLGAIVATTFAIILAGKLN